MAGAPSRACPQLHNFLPWGHTSYRFYHVPVADDNRLVTKPLAFGPLADYEVSTQLHEVTFLRELEPPDSPPLICCLVSCAFHFLSHLGPSRSNWDVLASPPRHLWLLNLACLYWTSLACPLIQLWAGIRLIFRVLAWCMSWIQSSAPKTKEKNLALAPQHQPLGSNLCQDNGGLGSQARERDSLHIQFLSLRQTNH